MRYEVSERGSEIAIHVSNAAGHTTELLLSMQECESGQFGCPADQLGVESTFQMPPPVYGGI